MKSIFILIQPTWPKALKWSLVLALTVSALSIMSNTSSACEPVPMPEGTYEHFWQLNIMSSNGSNVGSVTEKSSTYLGEPAWSSDAKKIAFVSKTNEGDDIFVINADGTGKTRLTTSGREYSPAWSIDDKKIVIKSSRDGNNEIYVMDADGSDQTRLTASDSSDFDPTFAPDGEKIVFVSQKDSNSSINSIEIDGENQVSLYGSSDTSMSDPAFSRDGTKIAFVASNSNNGFDLYTMEPDGTQITGVTNDNRSGLYRNDPSWSPDGKQLAFSSLQDDLLCGRYFFHIYVINADGTDEAMLNPTDANENAHPSWSTDGQIAFVSYKRIFHETGHVSPLYEGPRLSAKLKPNTAGAYPKALFKISQDQSPESVRSFSIRLGSGSKAKQLRFGTSRLARKGKARSKGIPIGSISISPDKRGPTIGGIVYGQNRRVKVKSDRRYLRKLSKKIKKAKKKSVKSLAKRDLATVRRLQKTLQKKTRITLKGNVLKVSGLPNVKSKSISLLLNGKKYRLLRNPLEAGTVKLSGSFKLSGNTDVKAEAKVKIRKH